MNDNNLPLFNEATEIEKEWKGMPEFVQIKQKPYAEIIFRFASKKDLQEFSRLINQTLTMKTKSAWYPQLFRGKDGNKRWKSES